METVSSWGHWMWWDCVRQAGVISWCIWVSISGLMPVERMIVLEGTGDVRPWACRQALRLRRICFGA